MGKPKKIDATNVRRGIPSKNSLLRPAHVPQRGAWGVARCVASVLYEAVTFGHNPTVATAGCSTALPSTVEQGSARDRSAWFPVGQRGDRAASRLVGGLIARRVLFEGRPRGWVRVSHDGEHLAWVEAAHGASNVWVAPVDDLASARAVTPFRKGSIVGLYWAHTGRHIVVLRDVTGEENDRLHSVNITTGKVVDLAALPGVQVRLEQLSHRVRKQVLISTNERDRAHHDLYVVDVRSGARKLLFENPGYRQIIADARFQVRLCQARDKTFFHPDGRELVPRGLLEPGDEAIEFDDSGTKLYLLGRAYSGNRALVQVDFRHGRRTVLADVDRFDVEGVLLHPKRKSVQAVMWTSERPVWRFLDPEVELDFEALHHVEDGDVHIASRSLDDRQWVVAFDRDDAPVRYYAYDRTTKRPCRLFAQNSELEGLPLAPMQSVHIRARDRLSLVSYLTLPSRERDRREAQPGPMVLLVHGGPHDRDRWGYDVEHQWLANRGYAVLSVNYRGSTGFGRAFLEAGRREWGAKMQDDLLAAVDWAVVQGVAAPDRVAIMGASYGGYAALAGLTFTPERFACGVAFAGPSNLVSTVRRIPPYWDRRAGYWWIGDPRTPEGRAQLLQRSPLERADRAERPLLVAHGAKDPRVPRAESDRMVAAMRKASKQVTYLLFFDEGHGLSRSSNRLSFYAVVEAFLAKHLGGRAEPFGSDVADADFIVLAGAELVPGLERIAKTRRARRY